MQKLIYLKYCSVIFNRLNTTLVRLKCLGQVLQRLFSKNVILVQFHSNFGSDFIPIQFHLKFGLISILVQIHYNFNKTWAVLLSANKSASSVVFSLDPESTWFQIFVAFVFFCICIFCICIWCICIFVFVGVALVVFIPTSTWFQIFPIIVCRVSLPLPQFRVFSITEETLLPKFPNLPKLELLGSQGGSIWEPLWFERRVGG